MQCYNNLMKSKTYLIYDQSEYLINGKYNFFHRLGGPLHVHRQVEMMYCVRGTVTVQLGERKVILNEKDFVLVKPYELHCYKADFKVTNLFISPIFPDAVSSRISMYLFDNVVCHDDNEVIKDFLSLYKHFDALPAESRILYFQILENLVDTAAAKILKKPTDSIDEEILQYISENFNENLTLESVAAACCTNRSTVSRTVNRQCACNFNTYLNHVRINRFLEICLNGETENIEQVAQRVGFQSPRTFYRAFQSEFRTTPKQYLETLQNNNSTSN